MYILCFVFDILLSIYKNLQNSLKLDTEQNNCQKLLHVGFCTDMYIYISWFFRKIYLGSYGTIM